ncbi:hypothetical protein MLD38_012801 [Melastoma candidum]|uniref:Uncharacterized protein n=1 Tax=Melastoma candidum TaxID=119954 RepID=A0ACB9RAL1_9MYRT|nr:hypothetical protein MLD38_012801 [Melastoma candidum]
MAHYHDTSLPSHTTSCYFPHLPLPPLDHPASSPYPTPAPALRPRGCPPGSKNKPKPPVILPRDFPDSLHMHILELSLGADILTSLTKYARQRGRGLTVLSGLGTILSGLGTVLDISLCHSGSLALLNLRGKFKIMTLTGTVLPPPAPLGSGGLAVFMSGPQGQVVGGYVAGRLVAAGPVMLVASSFSYAVYESLPLTGESEEGGWEGRVDGGPQTSSGMGTGGGWVGDRSCTGFDSLTNGGDLLGWAGDRMKA